RVVIDVGVSQSKGVVCQQQDVHGCIGAHPRLLADHLIDELQVVSIRTDRAANHAVRIAQANHHGADQGQTAAHFHTRHFLGDAAAAHELPVSGPVPVEAFVVVRIGDFVVLIKSQTQTVFLNAICNDGGTAHEDGSRQAFVDNDLHCPQYALVLAFRKDDAALQTVAHHLLN